MARHHSRCLKRGQVSANSRSQPTSLNTAFMLEREYTPRGVPWRAITVAVSSAVVISYLLTITIQAFNINIVHNYCLSFCRSERQLSQPTN
ncbi:hypothetical protein J6590_051958 [Homalodisca vitripennis]|nr:hypothetical protein J6590_051958 [Homalodisca vitripennis]